MFDTFWIEVVAAIADGYFRACAVASDRCFDRRVFSTDDQQPLSKVAVWFIKIVTDMGPVLTGDVQQSRVGHATDGQDDTSRLI